MEEIQPISLQSKKKAFPDLNYTNGKRVRFKYKFSTGQKIRFIVRDGEVSTGDMILGSYDRLIKAIEEFEAGLVGGVESDTLTSQGVITKKFCKARVIFCFDHDGAKWPNGIIYYEQPSTQDFPQYLVDIIEDVIKEIEDKTKINFVKSTTAKNRIYFSSNKDGCYTYLGMAGGTQRVNLERGCWTRGIVRHELGHVIGMIHEQTRSDRGPYIKINSENIRSGKHDQFDRWRKGHAAQTPYDYDSVMHYGEYAFSKNGKPTITALNGRTGLGGSVFTQNDVRVINSYYK